VAGAGIGVLVGYLLDGPITSRRRAEWTAPWRRSSPGIATSSGPRVGSPSRSSWSTRLRSTCS